MLLSKKIITTAVLTSTLALGVLGYTYLYKPNNVVIMEPINIFDTSNKELLVGWSDNVFIGTVIDKEKETNDEIAPLSIYEVEVQTNIKGNLDENVKVSQRIGYDNAEKSLYKFEGDQYLQAGKKYLFVSKYDVNTNSHRIVPVEGNILLNTPVDEKSILIEFEQAFLNQRDYTTPIVNK